MQQLTAPLWPGDGVSRVKDEPGVVAADPENREAATTVKGSPEDPADDRKKRDRRSAANIKYNARKRERRWERNSLVSKLDHLLPHNARNYDSRGAGVRSAGMMGRSITTVLANTVKHLKTLKAEGWGRSQRPREPTSAQVKYRDGE